MRSAVDCAAAIQDVWPAGATYDAVKDVEAIVPTAITALNQALFGISSTHRLFIDGQAILLYPVRQEMYQDNRLLKRAQDITGTYVDINGRRRQFNGQWGKVTFVIEEAHLFDGKHAWVSWYTYIDLHSTGRGHIATTIMKCRFTVTVRTKRGVRDASRYYLGLTTSVEELPSANQALAKLFHDSSNRAKNLEWVAKHRTYRGGLPQ